MRAIVLGPVFASLVIFSASCKKSGSGGGDDSGFVTGPSANSLSGVWTGTISRTGGGTPIAVRIEATHSGNRFSGPITLTLGNVTLRGNVDGEMANSPPKLMLPIDLRDAATLPNCNVRTGGGNTPNPTFENMTTTTRQMTASNVGMQYFNCQGFVEPDPLSNVHQEVGVQLTLNKQ